MIASKKNIFEGEFLQLIALESSFALSFVGKKQPVCEELEAN